MSSRSQIGTYLPKPGAEEGISNPLKARLSLAQGEIWLLQQRYAEASQALSDAVTRFHEESDRWSQVEALLLRGRSERYQGSVTSANITLWAVAIAFKCLRRRNGVRVRARATGFDRRRDGAICLGDRVKAGGAERHCQACFPTGSYHAGAEHIW